MGDVQAGLDVQTWVFESLYFGMGLTAFCQAVVLKIDVYF